jgi:hypothetical protein
MFYFRSAIREMAMIPDIDVSAEAERLKDMGRKAAETEQEKTVCMSTKRDKHVR